jgi:hypothetical protein
MPYIRVVYRSKRYFDYVSSYLLDVLISRDEITHFYRPSEGKWISIRFDPVRGIGGRYGGPERRRTGMKSMPEEQETEKESLRTKGHSKDWLQSLWQYIENS